MDKMSRNVSSNSEISVSECLISGQFIDSENPDVRAFAERARNDAVGSLESAINLYYVVRDEIHYDPYYVGAASRYRKIIHDGWQTRSKAPRVLPFSSHGSLHNRYWSSWWGLW